MIDREKIIRAIDSCFDYWLEQHRQLHPLDLERVRQLKADALTLLKEHDAVKPIKQIEQNEWTVCGNCHKHLISKWTTCPYCGRLVKWDA